MFLTAAKGTCLLNGECIKLAYLVLYALSEQLAHSAVDLHLKEISKCLHGSDMNKKPHTPMTCAVRKLHLSPAA